MESTKNGFAAELYKLKTNSQKNISHNDFQHLKKIIWTNRVFFILGFSTAWIYPNPFSMLFIAFGFFGQWTMVGHHVCHGGYNKISKRYHSDNFAMGKRRFIDWPDLLYPPAWKYEHNILHHFYVNEKLDPDVPTTRIQHYLKPSWPLWFRFIVLCLNLCAWKITYYSPNTLKALHEKKNYNNSTPPSKYYKDAIWYCYLPYVSLHFILIPLLFFPLGSNAVLFVLINRVGAEIITNIHTFLTIVPNHAGCDIPLETKHFSSKEEFYLAQLRGAANYKTGGFWRDYFQGYLNYQVEHHLFPDLTLLQYVKIQPKVKAICEKYGVEYKQESIFIRIRKTFRVLLMIDKQRFA